MTEHILSLPVTGNTLSSMCFKALSKTIWRGETQLIQGLFWWNSLDDKWESVCQGPHTARTIISNPLFHSLCTSLPNQSLIFFSFPAVAAYFPSSSAQLLGTEAFVLSNPLDPSREALHGYPQGTVILLLQSPWLIVVRQALNSQLCSPLWSHFPESPSQKRATNQLWRP